jgi:selenocysteine-specific elongation factor
MKVIATAGHVDHGKSALVAALTGIHPDRLAEEQARGMTIDLGFAWMKLPSGEEVGIVDVPGHIDFIHNMLAGVGGIDAALLVVAADEGVMPQTREHLDILDLLELERGIVALTKTDLVDDPDWLALVAEEVRELLAPTRLAAAPLVPVSAHTGAGLEALRAALATVLATAPPRPDLGRPRLPIDRVFTIAGFGTVVTGTLVDGSLHLGDEVVILPGELRARIRGLQTHKTKREVAVPGSRVAVNLSGVRPDQIARGHVLTYPNLIRETRRVDVRLRVPAAAPVPLRHNMTITFHSAAAETPGRLRLLEADELPPGATGWAQIELHKPLALARGDHFIVRRPSPSQTLGGGVILDPVPRRRHRRRRPEVMAHFELLWRGTPADLVADLIARTGPLPADQVLAAIPLPADRVQAALDELQRTGRVEPLDPTDPASPLITPAGWETLRRRLTELLASFHQAYPLRLGMGREEVKSRLQPRTGWSTRLFNAIVARAVAEGVVREVGTSLALPDFQPYFTPAQRAAVDRLLAQFRAAPFNPPAVRDGIAAVGEDVFNALLEQQVLIRVAPDVVFTRSAYEDMVAAVCRYIDEHGAITVASCRDLFGTSRKYALALLEYLDQIRITRREGDVRVRW